MTLHPSGLTWERWNFPFKTPEERLKIMLWLHPKEIFDNSTPF